MSGSQIANEVHAGILDAVGSTGDDPFRVVLRKKTLAGFNYFNLNSVRTKKKAWDAMAMVQRTHDVLLVSPLSETPMKGDHVAFGVDAASGASVDKWSRINNVETINPSGVDLMHRLYLEE